MVSCSSMIRFHKTQAHSVSITNTLSSRTTSRIRTAPYLVTAGIKRRTMTFSPLYQIAPLVPLT